MRYRFTLNPDTDNEQVPEPIGWRAVTEHLKRDPVSHGCFFEYIIDLEFSDAGFKYIKAQYDLLGSEADIVMLVEEKCDEQGDYEEVYLGKLNLTKADFEHSRGCKVKVGVEPENCLMTFRNRYDQKVDLSATTSFGGASLASYDAINKEVVLPNKKLPKQIYCETAHCFGEYSEDYTHFAAGGNVIINHYSYWEIGFDNVVNNEINYFGNLTLNRKSGATGVSGDPGPVDISPIFTCNEKNTYYFEAFLNLKYYFGSYNDNGLLIDGSHGFEDYTITLVFEINGVPTTYTIGPIVGINPAMTTCDPPDSAVQTQYAVSIVFPIAMDVGDKLKLYSRVNMRSEYINNPGAVNISFCERLELNNAGDENSYLKIYVESNYPETQGKITLVNEALSRVAEAVTDDCMRVYSDYFGRTDAQPYTSVADGCGSLEAITSGLHLRDFPNPVLKLSFKDLMDGLRPIHNIGFGPEPDPNRTGFNLLRVEPIEYFYNDSVILQCDKIMKVHRKVLTDHIYSLFKIGYQKWEGIEEYVLFDEFNTSREYRTTLNKVSNVLEQISKFIASGYAIELTRRKQYKPTSEDEGWRYDHETFIVCLKRDDTTFIPEQGNIDNAANLIDAPTVINFRISPARNAQRWMKWLMQSYKNPFASSIKFTNGTGNYKAEGELNSGCIIEDGVLTEQQDIDIVTFGSAADGLPFLVPEMYEFTYPLSRAAFKAVKANPYGIVQIRWGDEVDFVNTHIQHIQYKPNQGIAEFQLIPRYPLASDEVNNNLELREDGGIELREDSGYEERE